MQHITFNSPALLIALAVTGCGPLASGAREQPDAGPTRPMARPLVATIAPDRSARTAEEFDTTSKSQRQQAVAAATGKAPVLGRTIASLGDPSRPGFWLETALVKGASKGSVVNPANGNKVAVDLIPIDGTPSSGSRISLAAMRVLGVALTDLPELVVYGP